MVKVFINKGGWLFLLSLFLTNINSAQILLEPIMISSISDSIPVRAEYKELCKTVEGREAIIATWDTLELRDLRYQWLGIKENDSTYKTTYHEYLLKYAEMVCTPIPGGQIIMIQDTTQMTFLIKEKLWCKSENTGGSHEYDCKEKIKIPLLVGWQVCKLQYKKSYIRHGRHKFEPIFFKNDTQNPPRCVGFNLHLTGHGDVGNPSKIEISDIRIFAIRDYYDNTYRKKCGCDVFMPEAPKPITPKPVPKPPSSPASFSYNIVNKRTNAADFVVQNNGGSTGRLYYKISVLDGDDGIWDNYEEGYIELNPNSVYSNGLHKWRALDWRIDYAVSQ